MLSGVPQGTVLGPLLFLLYINDLPNVVKNSKISLYADDAKLFFKVRNQDDVARLHEDILSVIKWADDWQLRLALPKCAVLHIGGSYNPKIDFSTENCNIPSVSEIPDLGILMSEDLKFSKYIDQIVAKATRRIGVFFNIFKCRDTKFLLSIFRVYIRPLLEYNTPIWNPYLIGDIKKVESVQRMFTRRIPEARDMSYEQRLQILGLESLELRRLRNDLVETFKILHNFYDSLSPDIFVRDGNGRTRGHSWKLRLPPAAHFNVRSWFFSQRTLSVWNSLPAAVVEAQSLEIFKKRLHLVDLGRFLRLAGGF